MSTRTRRAAEDGAHGVRLAMIVEVVHLLTAYSHASELSLRIQFSK